MATIIDVNVPDIGNATDVDVIEVLVAVGDQINVDDSLITLESDKASMEIPAPKAGVVKELHINVGDKVSEGAVILSLEVVEEEGSSQQAEVKSEPETVSAEPAPQQQATQQVEDVVSGEAEVIDVLVPDIGDATDVDVIEVMIAPGDEVSKEDSLITLESDKASMEIPAPASGTIEAVKIKVGDKASQGTLVATMKTMVAAPASKPSPAAASKPVQPQQQQASKPAPVVAAESQPVAATTGKSHAGPAVRRFARELGVDLSKVVGKGRKGRILKQDVQAYVKNSMSKLQSGQASGGMGLPAAPSVDFSKFGDTESMPLNKIKRLTATNLSRNWLLVPHVTQFDDADITDLESFRKENKARAEKQGFKLTPIVFVMKAVVAALQKFPTFNASLDATGENLILKKYYNIGVAVDTPNGLVVAVIRDVDKKGIFQLAKELGEISTKAREKGLSMADMQGGCFTISSLGGIGGTAFTPIVNLPDVAILGLSRSSYKPVYQNGEFVPRLILPLSLSYDHRVIDGAEGARFTSYLASCLADLRQLLL